MYFKLSIAESALQSINVKKMVSKNQLTRKRCYQSALPQEEKLKQQRPKGCLGNTLLVENTYPGGLSLSATEDSDLFFNKFSTHLVQDDTLKTEHRQGDYCQELSYWIRTSRLFLLSAWQPAPS